MKKNLLFYSILSLASGCSSVPSTQVDIQNSAKIRVFHGTGVYMYPGKTCYDHSDAERIHAAAGGFSMLVSNKKVGMPVTEDIPWSYHEYVIPSGKPITMEMYFQIDGGGVKQSCGPVGAMFTPEAGKDYDTSMVFASGRCTVQLRELKEISPGTATGKIVTAQPAYLCNAN